MAKKFPHPYLPELEVVETGERMVFSVKSQSEPWTAPYRVDLLSYGGLSECNCPDFIARHGPVVKTGTRSCCKHIIAARHYFLNKLLPAMALQTDGDEGQSCE